jgi:maltokinase
MTDGSIEPAALAEILREWVPRQRWYAAKGREVQSLAVSSYTILAPGPPALHQAIVRVDGDPYQLFLGIQQEEVPHRIEHAVIGWAPVMGPDDEHARVPVVYDALHDTELTAVLIDNLILLPGAVVPTNLPSLVIGAEQSNTSVVFGDELILKVFRRLSPGINPDFEVTAALAQRGCKRIPRPLAHFETLFDGEPTTGAILTEYLRTAVDGWELAKTSVRDLYAEADLHADEVGGDFAGEAYRLGQATAEVHIDLAAALPTGSLDPAAVGGLAAAMQARLAAAVESVPALAPYERFLGEAFEGLARRPPGAGPIPLQRIHGDLHLGQALRTELGWFLIDFEGEPARPLAERRQPDSRLKDVAGMLRSFDYAARHMLVDSDLSISPQLEYRADEWATRNRDAFCGGYADTMGADPRDEEVLLRAYEIDKIVYEVMYEARNRPSWLPIPLASARRLSRTD